MYYSVETLVQDAGLRMTIQNTSGLPIGQANANELREYDVDAFWRLNELEIALNKIYCAYVKDWGDLSAYAGSISEMIDTARDQQSRLVDNLMRSQTRGVDDLKSKAKVLVAFLSAEEEDVMGMHIKTILQDFVIMNVRECPVPSTPNPPKRRPRQRAMSKRLENDRTTTSNISNIHHLQEG
jgi:hypothetical protein